MAMKSNADLSGRQQFSDFELFQRLFHHGCLYVMLHTKLCL